jgi:hypothetical protein
MVPRAIVWVALLQRKKSFRARSEELVRGGIGLPSHTPGITKCGIQEITHIFPKLFMFRSCNLLICSSLRVVDHKTVCRILNDLTTDSLLCEGEMISDVT